MLRALCVPLSRRESNRVQMSSSIQGPFQKRFNLFRGPLAQVLALREFPRREFTHDVIMELLQLIEGYFDALVGLLRIGQGRFPDDTFRIDHALNPPTTDCTVAGDRIAVNVSSPVQMSRR